MEFHSVELDNASMVSKDIVPGDAEKLSSNLNGDDSAALSTHFTDTDKINANITRDLDKESEKNDLSSISNVTDVHDSVQQKLSALCSNSNNESISRHNENNNSVSVNSCSSNLENNSDVHDEHSRKSLNDNEAVKSDDGSQNVGDRPKDDNEAEAVPEVDGALQEDINNVNNTSKDDLLDNSNADVETSVSTNKKQPQDVTEKVHGVDHNSSLSEASVSEKISSNSNEKEADKVNEEESRSKDICENSNASSAISHEQDDSNQPFTADETSMNLSETGAGSGGEYERTEQTRFLQCDDIAPEGDDVMDVIEVNAIDPFAQTIDSERNDNALMDVDEGINDLNRDISHEDMELTQGMVQEMDVTKITEKNTDETDTNKDAEMDVTNEGGDNDSDQSKVVEQDMDITKVNENNDTNKDEEMDVTNDQDIGKTKEVEQEEKDGAELSEKEASEAEPDATKELKDLKELEKSDETDLLDATKKLDNADDEAVTNDEQDVSNELEPSKAKATNDLDLHSKETSVLHSDGKSNEKPDTNEISKVTEDDQNKEDETKDSSSVESKGGDLDKSKDKLKNQVSSVAANSELRSSTVVENDDEDVCIIPDTPPRVPSDPSLIKYCGNKLKTILSKSKINVIEETKSAAATPVSSRPQRQAAKRADAQIKATVHQLEEDDGEKENDDEVVDTSKSTTSPQQQNQQTCQQCCKARVCRYKILSQGKVLSYLCSEICTTKYKESLNEHILAARAKKNDSTNTDISEDQQMKSADDSSSKAESVPSVTTVMDSRTPESIPVSMPVDSSVPPPTKRPLTRRYNEAGEFIRACSECGLAIQLDERTLSWETMDFCNEICLGKYQTSLGSYCAYCKKSVQQISLGKYCVRFGYDIRQFCCATCLEEFKKGLKVCSYCQKDISSSVEGFLAPVGDKGQFKDFCTQSCMEKYEQMSTNQRPPPQMHPCDVCKNNKLVQVEAIMDSKVSKLCSDVCFAAFKFVNTIKVDQCDMCRKYFDRANNATENLVYYDETQHNFCCKTCMNVFILAKRKIVPCNWCKVKKYNFDMIKRMSTDSQGVKQCLMMCSLNCLTLYQVSVNAVSSRRIKCDSCAAVAQAQYHLTMSDATIRNFCNYNCVMKFQAQYTKSPITLPGGKSASPIPTGIPKRVLPPTTAAGTVSVSNDAGSGGVPVISSVQSLAAMSDTSSSGKQVPSVQVSNAVSSISNPVPVSLQTASGVIGTPAVTPVLPQASAATSPFHVIVKPNQPCKVANKQVYCRPYMHTKGVSCRPHACAKQTQTDTTPEDDSRKILIPIPVPIYIPAPMHMYTLPTPTPFPIPIPIPVPIFIPTSRNSAKGILQEIKKIQEKMPADPFEAELLMMAEMVAEQKKQDETSDSDDDSRDADAGPSSTGDGGGDNTPAAGDEPAAVVESGSSYTGEVMEATSTTFGTDDMLQMALKMATEMDDQSNSSPPVDLEAELTPSTITPAPPQSREMSSSTSSRSNHTDGDENEEDVDDPEPAPRESRGRKRLGRPPGSSNRRSSSSSTPAVKRPRKSRSAGTNATPPVEPPPPPPVPIPVEKPDANMCLKFTFGVNAWKQWVTAKNVELEKLQTTSGNNRKVKLFKTDLLQLTADELNYSLCLFVKEARKPNGASYAPDTIYYFCLGIQQYLFENGRIDNIFTDAYYEKFTECLDEVAKIFSDVSDDSKLIVTRVEEEHLWESKQLGAHSPHVLLSTLMFFNTKHFNLTTVDEHMQLSFSHIMKHWKRNPSTPGTGGTPGKATPGSRNVLLRFYPPQSALDAPNSKKKKVYEQQENEENPLRCPVKLYEFYLSKCPESVKTRNDVFYLLPERSCVPDSPVWYSTMALGKEPLLKMLHRVKMVKEINIALRSS